MITKFRSSSLFFVLTVFALLLAACAPATSAPAALPNTGPAAAPATQAPVILIAQNAVLGKILTDSQGMTIYAFTKDAPGKSNCTGDCAGIWPPVTVPQGTTPTAGSGFSGTLGTIQRSDGTTQVTVNNMPVYTWVKDKKPGDTTGQNVGKIWFVLDQTGSLVKTVASAPAAAPASQGATIMVANTANQGSILTDGKGITLYLFAKDTPGVSTCYAQCAAAWPPLTVPQGVNPTAGSGFTGKLGTIQRTDGSLQVTINNLPVYYFAKDQKPGDAMGQGIGQVWFVIDPTGNMMKK